MSEKKKCFIITPIGGEHEPIRRHINGIIDAAIVPALGDSYEVEVAHRINVTGTITKQIISSIYNSDLVIANLTNRNPNVMYELAIRHCLGTPMIMIAEKDTSLPADIISERTIFYQNDAQGVLDLRQELKAYVEKIDYKQKSSPIYDALSDIATTNTILELTKKQDTTESDVLHYVVQKLDQIERCIGNTSAPSGTLLMYVSTFSYDETPNSTADELCEFLQSHVSADVCYIKDATIYLDSQRVTIIQMNYANMNNQDYDMIIRRIEYLLEQFGFVGVKFVRGDIKIV